MRARLPSATTLFFACVVLILLWLIVIPLGQMILNSFRVGHPAAPGPFTLKNYLVAYTSPVTYRMIFNTLLFAAGGTVITTLIAVLFAWLLERTDMPLQNLCWSLLLIPLAMPGLLFSMAYVFLFLPKSGLLNVFLRDGLSHFGVELSEGPINIYSLGGMIFLDGLRGVTTVFLMIAGAFRIMDPAMEEASFAAGAKNWATLKRVTLPVLRPALLAAVLYEFASSMESFEAPLVLGLPGRVYVYSTMIYISTRDAIPNYGLGAAFAASYFLLSLGLVYFYQRATVRQSERFATVGGKGYRPHRIKLGHWRYPALGAFYLLFSLRGHSSSRSACLDIAAAVLPTAIARGAGARSVGELSADIHRPEHPQSDLEHYDHRFRGGHGDRRACLCRLVASRARPRQRINGSR